MGAHLRRHVGGRRLAARGADAECAQLAVLDERKARRHDREGAVDATRDQVGRGRGRAAIGHMHHLDLGHVLEQLRAHMRRAAVARRREGDLACASRSPTERKGDAFGTTRRLGNRQMSVTGAKSATGS